MTGLDGIRSALASDDAEERRRAVAALAVTPGKERIDLLLAALGDEDWRVRKEAVGAAGAVGPTPKLARALVETFRSGDNVGLRNAAVEALAGLGPVAIDVLAAEIPGLDGDGRKLAVDTLARTADAGALPVLRLLVTDPDANVRGAAVEAVAAVGDAAHEDATRVLLGCLDSEDVLVRLAALDGLNRLEAAIPFERVAALVDHPVLGPSAIAAAGLSGVPRAAELLARCLERRGRSCEAAVRALADLARTGTSCLAAARKALREVDPRAVDLVLLRARAPDPPDLARAALLVAGALGTEAAADLALDALADDRSAAAAEEALLMMGEAAVGPMVARIRGGRPEDRASCLDLVGRVFAGDALRSSAASEPAALAVSAVNAALDDESEEVVRAALVAISELADESSLAPVAALLERGAPAAIFQGAEAALAACARRHPARGREIVLACRPGTAGVHPAVVIVGALESEGFGNVEEDLRFLSSAMTHESRDVRRAALDALAVTPSAAAVELVAFALTDEERDVRLAAVRALGLHRSPEGAHAGVNQLLDLVRSSDDEALVVAAIRALGDAGDARAVPVLRPIARGGPPLPAVSAVEAIAAVEDPHRLDALIDALTHPDAEVVKAALRSLREDPSPRVVTHVGACCDHEAWDVRRLAADLLGGMGGPVAVQILRSRLPTEDEPLVREAIQRGLAELEADGGTRRTMPPPGLGSWRP